MRSNIARLCEELGISLWRLSQDVGITANAIYKWERIGLDRAEFGLMVKVAERLGCDLSDLYGG